MLNKCCAVSCRVRLLGRQQVATTPNPLLLMLTHHLCSHASSMSRICLDGVNVIIVRGIRSRSRLSDRPLRVWLRSVGPSVSDVVRSSILAPPR
eukprot:2056517-Pyramimonas_sp.AAC.1